MLKRNKRTCVVQTWTPVWSSGDTPCVTTNWGQSCDTWIDTVGIQKDMGSSVHSENRRCSGVNKRLTQNTPKIYTGHVTQYSEYEPTNAFGSEVTRAMLWPSGSSWSFYIMTTEPLQMALRALQKVWVMEEAAFISSSKTPSSKWSSPLLHLVLSQAASLLCNSVCKSVTQFYSLLG